MAGVLEDIRTRRKTVAKKNLDLFEQAVKYGFIGVDTLTNKCWITKQANEMRGGSGQFVLVLNMVLATWVFSACAVAASLVLGLSFVMESNSNKVSLEEEVEEMEEMLKDTRTKGELKEFIRKLIREKKSI